MAPMEMEAGVASDAQEDYPLTSHASVPHDRPWARRAATAALVAGTAAALLAAGAPPGFARNHAMASARVKDGVTVLQDFDPAAQAAAPAALTGDAAAEAGLFQGDPDAAGGEDGVKDQNRAVEVDEPYAKLRLPTGIGADQRDVTESVVNLPTSPTPLQGATGCTSRFQVPPMPQLATDYNGAQLPDTCFTQPGGSDGNFHVYLIGDWGGLPGPFGWNGSMKAPAPADHRSPEFPSHQRNFIWGADDSAQRNVAEQMAKSAAENPPDYILNVGDNFYWGGINIKCGGHVGSVDDSTTQWQKVFEDVYVGDGIDGKQWLGVLGNHDFGGFMFVGGWDQAIHYTWMQGAPSTGRWVTPSLYYGSKVVYPDFSIDYLFVDTNKFDAWLPHAEQHHNLCSMNHNPPNMEATCGLVGPISAEECPDWFNNLWEAQLVWMDSHLSASTAEWQIVITHFPPEGDWGVEDWARLSATHGIDLMLGGHRHRQEMHTDSQLAPTTYVVSGGGGGITSENEPDPDGNDDEYGFVDLTVTAGEIMLDMISHGGLLRSSTCVTPRQRGASTLDPLMGTSLCDRPRPSAEEPAMPEQQPVVQQDTPVVQQPVVQEPVVQQPEVQQPEVPSVPVQQPAMPGMPVQQPAIPGVPVLQPGMVPPGVPPPVWPPVVEAPPPAPPGGLAGILARIRGIFHR